MTKREYRRDSDHCYAALRELEMSFSAANNEVMAARVNLDTALFRLQDVQKRLRSAVDWKSQLNFQHEKGLEEDDSVYIILQGLKDEAQYVQSIAALRRSAIAKVSLLECKVICGALLGREHDMAQLEQQGYSYQVLVGKADVNNLSELFNFEVVDESLSDQG